MHVADLVQRLSGSPDSGTGKWDSRQVSPNEHCLMSIHPHQYHLSIFPASLFIYHYSYSFHPALAWKDGELYEKRMPYQFVDFFGAFEQRGGRLLPRV